MTKFIISPAGWRQYLNPLLPDLIVTSLTMSPAAPVVGDRVVFTAVIKNQGYAATSGSIGMLFKVDNSAATWTTDTIGPLAPGASRSITATGGVEGNYWTATSGAHTIAATVNDTQAIAEIDLTNNTDELSITVVTGGGGGGGSPSSTWGPLGNTGSRWVINTPTYNASIPNVVECDCTWAAIKAAINSFTPSQVAAGAMVKVRPGALPGNGSGATATPVLQDVGSTSWSQRVLVRPRDGYGSVTMGNQRMFRVHGVSWAGFISGGWRIDSCINAGQAWIKCTGGPVWYTTGGEPDMTGLHVVEVVKPNSFVANSDVSDVWVKGGNLVSPIFEGLYLAPGWRPSGSSYHSDTMQFEPFNGAVVSNPTLRDCVGFGSTNSVVQINAINTGLIDHCYFVARGYCLTRYPIPSGGDPNTGSSWALNGGGKGGATPNLTVNNSAIIGAWKIEDYQNPSGVVVASASGNIVRSDWPAYAGTYTAYSGLTDDNFKSLTGLTPPGVPDVDYQLSTIWA